MITIEERDKYLYYLVDTDEELARAKAYMNGVENQKYTVLGMRYMDSDSKTVEKKKAESYTSLEYQKWCEKLEAAVYECETVRLKRITAALLVECWRSENSARTKGVII